MKGLIFAFAFMLFSMSAMGQEQQAVVSDVDDYAIVKDEVVDGIR